MALKEFAKREFKQGDAAGMIFSIAPDGVVTFYWDEIEKTAAKFRHGGTGPLDPVVATAHALLVLRP